MEKNEQPGTPPEQKQEIAKNEDNPIKGFFANPNVVKKFEEVLGSRASTFLTSVLQIANGNDKLKTANAVSLFNAAMTAATMDLPINQNLGFAWIVPYNGQAQFQMGYKGYIQLAMRSGQYARLNATEVHSNQFKSWDELTETLNADFNQVGDNNVVGYVGYFQLINGFRKTVYWSKERVWNHAQKFSKDKRDSSIWKTDFNSMALKTVIKAMLSKWGILSIEMQKAIQLDQAVIHNEEGTDFSYVDNEEISNEEKNTAKANLANDSALAGIKNLTDKAVNNKPK